VRLALPVRDRIVLGLLVFSAFLNYVDRANLSVGATDIQRELHLSNLDLGRLGSAFFATYALFQLLSLSGWLVDRFNVCWVYAIGFLIWSGATAITGVAGAFGVFFGLRLILGMSESVAYPSYSRILATTFPEHRRGLANALIDAGTRSGPAVATLAGGLLMARYGWRAFFVGLGAASLLWLIPWIIFMPRGAELGRKIDQGSDGPTTLAILGKREAWFSALGLFCSNYFWYFLVTWLPAYLEKERHFSKTEMAKSGSLAFLAAAVASVCAGWISDRWMARGGTPTRVRKTFAVGGLTLCTIILAVPLASNDRTAIPLLIVACLFMGTYSSTTFAITQTLAGARAAARWTGLQNGFGNLAGVAAPWFTGWVVDRTGQFYLAFLAAAAMALAGAACFMFGIREVRQVDFGPEPTEGVSLR
jgi:MFS family permease